MRNFHYSKCLNISGRYVQDKAYVEKMSPKIERLLEQLQSHFSRQFLGGGDSRAIVFANKRSVGKKIFTLIHELTISY